MLEDVTKPLQEKRREIVARLEYDQKQLDLIDSMLALAAKTEAGAPPLTPPSLHPNGPRLTNLHAIDAIKAYLKWAQGQGRQVTMDELVQELMKHRILTSRGMTLQEAQRPLSVITIAIARDAKQEVIVHKRRHNSGPGDIVEYRPAKEER